MDKRLRETIKRAVRRITWSWEAYKKIKKQAQVDKATFECRSCKCFCYSGKSDKNYLELVEKYKDKDIKRCSIYIDHIDPVEHPEKDWEGWDNYMERLFCSIKNLQPLCKPCHDEKTKKETDMRTEYRKEKKNGSVKTS